MHQSNNIDAKFFFDLFNDTLVNQREAHVGAAQWVSVHAKQLLSNCSYESLPEILDRSLRLPCSTDVPRYGLTL
jgi:hypothetical protein